MSVTSKKTGAHRKYHSVGRKARSLLQLERLEPRLNMASFYLNEVHFNPLFGDASRDQYVEIRSDLSASSLPNNTYLVVLEGTAGLSNAGHIHTMFNLSNQSFGTNGFLVLAESGNRYGFDPDARVLTGTDGFRGLPGNMFSTEVSLSNHIDFIVGSSSYLLIQTDLAPQIGDDIDTNDDGVPDNLWDQWTILDGFAALYWVDSNPASFGYAPIVFREQSVGSAPVATTIVNVEQLAYVARIGDSTGYSKNDWIAGNTTEEISNGPADFRLEHGIFGTPRPYAFAGRALDHIGNSNFNGRISGTVFRDENVDGIQQPNEASIPNVTLFADANLDGQSNGRSYRLEPDLFTDGFEVTNEGIGATLTVARNDNTQIGFVVRADARFPVVSGNPNLFASEGIPWFDDSGRLRIDFYRPASAVSIQFSGTSTLSPVYGKLEAFDENGQSLGFVRTGPLFDNQSQPLSLSFLNGSIAYAVAFCDDTYLDGIPFGELDDLRYVIPDAVTTTDSNGKYSLEMLAPGDYAVRALPPSGLIQQYPASGFYNHTVTKAEGRVDANFSFLPNQPPLFANQTFSVPENQPNGTTIGTPTFSDPDLGQSVSLAIVGGNLGNAFGLSGNTLIVHDTTKINYELSNQFLLIVEASDSYNPTAKTQATITVNILDANDPPSVANATVEVNEDLPLGTLVVQPVVSDEDASNNPNYTFQFVSGNSSGRFSIHPTTGEIRLQNSLDYETSTSHTLVIRATDTSSPPLVGQGTITVNVRNVNEAPFIGSTTLALDENSPAGTLLPPISVIEPDAGQTTQWAIVGGTASSLLEFPETGNRLRVRPNANFDFETTGFYTIEVRATDNGTPTLSATKILTIAIQNVNDAPQITSSTFTVDENIPTDTVIGTLVASDQDEGQTLTFAIVSGVDSSLFRIDPSTGVLRPSVGSTLDFESKSMMVIQVRATDDASIPKSTTVPITIQLVDRNDPPQIESQEFSLNENSPGSTSVGSMTATDPDAGDTLSYSIEANPLIAIDASTGAVTTLPTAVLDFEQTPHQTFVVTVTDANSISRQANLVLRLNDLNEAPVLAGDIEKKTVASGQSFSYVVPTSLFTDVDANDQLTFTATSNDGFSLPAWLTFTASTRTFSGTPNTSDLGLSSIRLRATDRGGLSATEFFDIEVINGWHNGDKPLDVDRKGNIVALDALLVINYLNLGLPLDAPKQGLPATNALDVTNDQFITALDALRIINFLNINGPSGEGESNGAGEGARASEQSPQSSETSEDSNMNGLLDLLALDQERRRRS